MNEINETKKPNFFRRMFIFGTTPSLWLNLLGMLLASLLVLWLTFGGLRCYTKQGRTYEVPDFTDMTRTELEEEMKQSRYAFEIKKSLFTDKSKRNRVIKQSPLPGDRAKSGRKIYITIHPAQSKAIVIPRMWGDNFDYAKARLKNLKLEHKVIKKVLDAKVHNAVNEVYFKGVLVEKEKYWDTVKAFAGDTIELVITENYDGGMTQIPDLSCLTYSEAMFKIHNGHNLTIGGLGVDGTVTDTMTAYVVGQYPIYEPGRYISVGTRVDLRLSQRKPASCGGSGYDDIPQDWGGDDDTGQDLGF